MNCRVVLAILMLDVLTCSRRTAFSSELRSMGLRLTTGLTYCDPARRLPMLLFGVGASVLLAAVVPFALGTIAKISYPLVPPIPMLTLSGACALP